MADTAPRPYIEPLKIVETKRVAYPAGLELVDLIARAFIQGGGGT